MTTTPATQARKPTLAELRRWSARAETVWSKASALFKDIEAALGDDEPDIHPLAGDTLCSSAELANTLEATLVRRLTENTHD